MFSLLCSILAIIVPLLLVWLLGGCIAVWLHYADTMQEGMAKIGRILLHFIKSDNMESSGMTIPDYQCEPLTVELRPYFSVLVLLSATMDSDIQTIVYRQNGCNIGIDIVEIIYRKFLQKALNLNINAPLYVYVDIDDEYLYLYVAISEDGRKKIEQARNNRRSREMPINEDILL